MRHILAVLLCAAFSTQCATIVEQLANGYPMGSGVVSVTKGGVYVANGTNFVSLSVGSNTQVLTADSTAANGVKWATPSGGGGGGSGTVTNTGGDLTSNAIVLGAGTVDTKVAAGIITDGTSQITLGVNTTTLGKVKMFGNTSGDVTIEPNAVAGTGIVLILPATSTTLVGKTTTDTLTNKTLTSPVINTGTGSFGGTLASATLYPGDSSLVTTGTISTGTWAGTAVAVIHGGTGATSAGITAFNNISGFTAAGATGTTSTNLVFSTSPTLVTPALGTPTSGSLSSCTGYAVANLTGAGTGVLTWVATPTFSNLVTAVTGDTVMGINASQTVSNKSFVAPALGTPASGVLTNCTSTTVSQNDNSTKLATTAYVDAAVLSQNFKEAAKYATTGALAASTYSNGTSGVGATLTEVGLGAVSFDGSTPSISDRVLVKNQVSTFQNGIYSVTIVGTAGTAFVLTRATDADQANEYKTGDSIFITSGSTYTSTTWAYTGADSPVIGTGAITYAQVAGQGSFTSGTGITITGTSIAIDTSVTVDKTTTQTLTNKTLTSPTLTTPTLGTPASGNLSSCTGYVGTSTLVTTGTVTTGTWNSRFKRRITTQTSSATPTMNTDNTDLYTLTALGANVTSFTTNLTGTPNEGDTLLMRIKDLGGPWTLSFGASFAARGVALPTTTVAGKYLYIGFLWNATTSTWDCVASCEE